MGRAIYLGMTKLSSFVDKTYVENGWNKLTHLTLLRMLSLKNKYLHSSFMLTVSNNGELFGFPCKECLTFGKNKIRNKCKHNYRTWRFLKKKYLRFPGQFAAFEMSIKVIFE